MTWNSGPMLLPPEGGGSSVPLGSDDITNLDAADELDEDDEDVPQ